MRPHVLILKSTRRLVVLVTIAQALAGCHNSSGRSSAVIVPQVAQPSVPVASPPATSPEPATHGYFSGSVEGHYGEALLTVEGLIRIYVDGVPGAPDTLGSRQLVGRLEFTDGEAYGTGLVHTQGCDQSDGSTVCGGAEPAEVTITTATRDALLGEITLASGEVWSFDMRWPTVTYLEPATLEFASGQYTETLAEPALDAVISVDSDGRIFFQSPQSGCVGNGGLVPHAGGAFNVYDVELLVESCASGYEAGNGEFEGLATRTVGDPWSYWGDWLVLWLSTVESAPVPQAFVMWGLRISE